MAKSSWRPHEIMTFIEAYKAEPCLYWISSPAYRNKRKRADAWTRVFAQVNVVRPGTTLEELYKKLRTLRTQYSCEKAKVDDSVKSGVGPDEIYTPSLWYYPHLDFLKDYVVRRKNKDSMNDSFLSQATEKQDLNSTFSEGLVPKYADEDSTDIVLTPSLSNPGQSTTASPLISSVFSLNQPTKPSLTTIPTSVIPPTKPSVGHSVTPSLTSSIEPPLRSSASISSSESSLVSCSELPEVPSTSFSRSTSRPKRKRRIEDPILDSVAKLTGALGEQIKLSPKKKDSVDMCMAFVGELVKSIKSDKKRDEVMKTIIETAFAAKEYNDES